jgi:regulatory protein YycI of two-component signal transduction system YycFG
MDAFQILVIILSVFLVIFLLLGIILTVVLIKTSLKIKRVAVKLDDAADNVRATTETIKTTVSDLAKMASPAIIAKIVIKYIRNKFNRRRES